MLSIITIDPSDLYQDLESNLELIGLFTRDLMGVGKVELDRLEDTQSEFFFLIKHFIYFVIISITTDSLSLQYQFDKTMIVMGKQKIVLQDICHRMDLVHGEA